jgi:cytochrome oxidase Cu insertion factor (SCO1/SenC/PrrC family)
MVRKWWAGMNRRSLSWLVTALGLLLVVVSILLYNHLADAYASHGSTATPTPNWRAALQQGVDLGAAPAPPFSLQDQTGATISLDQLRGQPVVLTFFDSVCPHADCSLMAEYLNWTAGDLGPQSAHVAWVAISVDPWHDTPVTATAFLVSRQVRMPFHFLLGTLAQLAPVWAAYHMQALLQPDGVVIHTTGVYVLDAQARERLYLDEGFDPKVLSAYLHHLLTGPGVDTTAGGTATPGQPTNVFAQAQTVGGETIGLTAVSGQYGTYTFTVEVQDNQGVPLQGATVALDLSMPAMAMTPLHVTLSPMSPPVPGTYQAQGVLSMRGQWQVVVQVLAPGATQPVQATFQFNAVY